MKPVTITSLTPEGVWGTVALHGPKTGKSLLSHLVLENGSGKIVDHVHYIAMLSIHEAKDVEFRNLTLRNNSAFDDMMHVIYSDNIRLRDCRFENAYSDGLDVDISEIRIHGCKIINSGNDAIDLMSSRALIEGALLQGSGDKGVSDG